MISAESAIRALRRDLTLSTLIKYVLLSAAGLCLLVGPMYASRGGLTVLIVLIGAVGLTLSYRSIKGSNLSADSPFLIATGQFEEAEERIEQALRRFSLFRAVKLLSLHHLAILRHAQRRWRESALLSRALLHQRLGALQNISRSSRLMLADSLLELGDMDGAHEAIQGLYQERLTLVEAMNLMVVQLDYEARIGAWEGMMRNLMSKVQLAEIMPAVSAAKAQAMLALAAKKVGRHDWAQWLTRRAALLTDINALVAMRPMLGELLIPENGPENK
jgi:hypothetical protein